MGIDRQPRAALKERRLSVRPSPTLMSMGKSKRNVKMSNNLTPPINRGWPHGGVTPIILAAAILIATTASAASYRLDYYNYRFSVGLPGAGVTKVFETEPKWQTMTVRECVKVLDAGLAKHDWELPQSDM